MIPWYFVYVSEEYNKQKVYVTILSKFKHHFTGETMYRIHEEGEFGWVDEGFYGEETILEWLKLKVEE